MEFYEKLQELRKQKGLTQEELAQRLYVTRTAVSRWESGRGYPNIESLKSIAKVFGVTVDQLLSSDEVLIVAEADHRQKEAHFRNLVYGLLDLSVLLLLFLPFFTARAGGVVSVSLVSLVGVQLYVKVAYVAIVVGIGTVGVLLLIAPRVGISIKHKVSLMLGTLAVLLFVIGAQPYAAIFAFALLAIKVLVLLKRM